MLTISSVRSASCRLPVAAMMGIMLLLAGPMPAGAETLNDGAAQPKCGKLMSVIFKISPSSDPEFSSVYMLNEEFCDEGRFEHNANYILSLYDTDDNLVYDKFVYINPMVFHEGVNPKEPGKLTLQKIEKTPVSRIVKFALPTGKELKRYTIKSIKENKIFHKDFKPTS